MIWNIHDLPRNIPEYGTFTKYSELEDLIVSQHYYVGALDWWMVEYDKSSETFKGFEKIGFQDNGEWRLISVDYLKTVMLPFQEVRHILGLDTYVKMDEFWKPTPVGEIAVIMQRYR